MNYDVFNTLNLINHKLGVAHQNKGFNPFGLDFKLSVQTIKKLLNAKNSPCKEIMPDVVNLPLRKANSALKVGKARIDALITQLQLTSKNAPTQKIFDGICYLKICQELLADVKLSNNTFDEVVEILKVIKCLDPEYARCINNIFSATYSTKLTLQKFVELGINYKQHKKKPEIENLRDLVHKKSASNNREKPQARKSNNLENFQENSK